ncbi:3-isopropylmalate dehydratase small subunit [Candidatus Gottesmanbacteria bacterium]|nr:3-isopropylmalate dehydratase small subunit [Candidatus Gottesmanbacteria bacterium]
MNKFTTFSSNCLPIRDENIDTDQIVPARFLKIISREGWGKYLFYDRRDLLKKTKAKILVAGNNFGCGSSREHAAWAIGDYGFRVVISSSFGDIFYNNSLKNGLLCVVVKPKELEELIERIEKNPKTELTVDLEKQEVRGKDFLYQFEIDSFRKRCLLKGVDEMGYILSYSEMINRFEMKQK